MRFAVFLVVAAFLAACRSPTPVSTIEQNKNVVRRLYEEASNHHDLALMKELVAPDFVAADQQRGPEGYARGIETLRAGMPDVAFTIEDLLAEGDQVAVRWTFEGTQTGTFRGFPPTGKKLRCEGIAIYELRAGQVVKVALQNDRLGLLQQVGAVPEGIGAVKK